MTEITLPKLGEMTEEAVLVEWLVQVGDSVSRGTPVAVVDTDKVEAEVESTVAGKVSALLVQPEDEIPVGAAICTIEEASD